jgi:hypothetical protein
MVHPAIEATPIKQRLNLGAPGKVPVKMVEALDWKGFFRWMGKLMKDNPPPAANSGLYAQFKAIGLSVEKGFNPDGLSEATLKGIERGFGAGMQVIEREALKSGATEINGWAYNMSQGKWGQDFNLRAAIAYRSLGQNTAEEALYFNTRKTGKGKTLNGKNTYSLTFPKGEQPPVNAFWSITMYNAENFFVDNSINRYAIGNRTQGLKTGKDGSLTIYIQNEAPEGEMKANWLPAPDGDFRLSMRLYNPKKSVLAGSWQPSAVKLTK